MSSGSEADRNIAVTRTALDAFQRGDVKAFLDFLDPEVEIYSPPELPNPAHFRGRDGYLPWAARWLEAWETFELDPQGFEPLGEHHVLMPTVQRGVGKGSGLEVEMQVCYMLELHDGVATRVHLYADREAALAAAEAGEKG